MSQSSDPGPRKKAGRPRNEAIHRAVLDAAYGLLMEHGFARLTIEAVARAAGVGKPTIYRYWNNAQELAMAALLSRPDIEDPADSGRTIRDRLKAHMRGVTSAFGTNRGRQITLTVASADPESELAKAFRHQIILKSRDVGRNLIQTAIANGELEAIGDLETALDMVYGPIFYRLLIGHRPLTPAFGDNLIDTLFDGIGSRG